MADEAEVPRLARGFRFRHDPVRDSWLILGPERAFVPDETAVAILQMVDGTRTLGAIIDALAARYDAPRTLIAADTLALAADLSRQGMLRLALPG